MFFGEILSPQSVAYYPTSLKYAILLFLKERSKIPEEQMIAKLTPMRCPPPIDP
jgi:hypothetical protein